MKRNAKSQNEAPANRVRHFALLLQLALLSLPAQAAVNVQTAAFIRSETDWISKDGQFRLTREYSSRNLHMGLFGFGWCSNLEVVLLANPDGSLKVRYCNGTPDEIFRRRAPLMDETPVYARPGTDEYLVAKDGQFFLYKTNGAVERFDKKGRWVGHTEAVTAREWRLFYNQSDFPVQLNINGESLDIEPAYGSRRIQRLHSSIFEANYHYDKQDLGIAKVSKRSMSYKYDDFHNLIMVRELNGEATEIAYDDSADRVTRVKTSRCIEKYNYVTQPERFRTEVFALCTGRLPMRLRYDFNWRLNQAKLDTLKIQTGEMAWRPL